MPATTPTIIQTLLPEFKLKIEGADAPPDVAGEILEITVENSLHLPDLCTIRLHGFDTAVFDFKFLDDDIFAVGKKIEVSGGYGNDLSPLFTGEVTALEMDLAAHGTPTVTVRALDKSHRLHRGRKSRSFQNVTDSDLVSQISAEAGLTAGTIDSTSEVHDWVFQNNQTNWEFLAARAHRVGHRLYVEGDGTLYFKKVENSEGDAVTLEWGQNLRSFRPRVSAGHQVNSVTVHGWDRKTKQAIIGTATTPNGIPQTGGNTDGGSVAQAAFGSAEMHVMDRPVFSQDEAQVMSQSVLDDIAGEFVEGDGLSAGDPNIKAGEMVSVQNVGTRYSGTYLVTSTTHVFSPAEGYSTLFSINGKRPANLLSILHDETGGARANLGGNIVIGVVTNNNDPDKVGRVKVKYPWITDNDESWWAPIAVPMSGGGRGFYFLPEINDEVLVAFEHGDIHRPYVIGALWNGVDNPIEGNDVAVVDGKVVHRIIKTRIGHTILLDDTDEKGAMTMTSNYGHVLTLNDKDTNITAITKNGHKVFLDDQADQIIVVDKTGSNKMTIKSNDNSIAIECAGNFSVKAQGNVDIQGQQGIKMSTPMQLEAKASSGVTVTSDTTMQLKANATMDVEATGPMTIKGAIVQIN